MGEVREHRVEPTDAGFYYLRFPEPGSVPQEDEQYFGRIYFHRLGDPQPADALVFAHPDAGSGAAGPRHRERPLGS